MQKKIDPEKVHQISQRIIALCEYYRVEFGKMTFAMYVSDLAQYDIAAIDKAIELHRRHVENGKFMPKSAHLIEYIEKMSVRGLMGQRIEEAALNAWDAVMQAVRTQGRYSDVRFDDPIIHAVIKVMGGWLHFCNIELKDREWEQRQFEKRYLLLARNKPKQHTSEFLMGEYTHHWDSIQLKN